MASPAVRVPRRLPLPRVPDLIPAAAAERVRDDLTRSRLLAAASHLPGLEVLGYEPQWWDGQSHVPCLVIRGGRRCRRLRVVETTGDCVIVPFSRRMASRWLAARRRPRRVELSAWSMPVDTRRDVVLDASSDVTRCVTTACGALLPVGYEGDCPVCGG